MIVNDTPKPDVKVTRHEQLRYGAFAAAVRLTGEATERLQASARLVGDLIDADYNTKTPPPPKDAVCKCNSGPDYNDPGACEIHAEHGFPAAREIWDRLTPILDDLIDLDRFIAMRAMKHVEYGVELSRIDQQCGNVERDGEILRG